MTDIKDNSPPLRKCISCRVVSWPVEQKAKEHPMTTNEHTEQSERAELKPCPFCGAGSTQIVENGKVWAGMKYSEPTSVSVRHHCEPIKGQPSRMLERVGKDRESAISAWNMRAAALLAEDKPAESGKVKE